MTTKDYRSAVDRLIGQRDMLLQQLKESKERIKSLKREEDDCQKAKLLVQVTAKNTQDQLRYHLSELAKLALAAVFDDPYEFEIAFEQRRGRTEADFWFVRQGERIDPGANTGLGAVDIAGLAIRTSLWSLRKPRSRASIWTDEPFKHLKGEEANKRALQILQEICRPQPKKHWPGIQLVMIADERAPREELEERSDRIFEVIKRRTKSIVLQS